MVSGPGSSQARFERGRSRPTSSITMATSGRLLRSRNGTAFLRQVSALDAAAASCTLGRGFSSSVGRGWPGSTSVYLGRSGRSSMRAYFGADAGPVADPRFISSSVSRASRSPSLPSRRSASQ